MDGMVAFDGGRSGRSLVTGASGFVGSRLVARLAAAGAAVTVLLAEWEPDSELIRSGVIDRVEVCKGRLEDFELIERTVRLGGFETVYHLAAVAQQDAAFADPLRAFEANIRGTYHVLEACRRAAGSVKRVLVASSDKAYGDGARLPYDESMAMNGLNPYDVSKSCADLLARSYHASYGVPVAVGRYGNTFGPGDRNFSRLIPGTVRRLLAGQSPVIKRPGGQDFSRDFLYIEDSVESYFAMAAGIDRGVAGGEAYNFAMGVSYSPTRIVEQLQRLMGAEHLVPQVIEPPHEEILHQQVSNTKARDRLGWAPRWTMEDGLAATVAWYTDLLAHHGDDAEVPA